jgi:chromosome segregation ATPase
MPAIDFGPQIDSHEDRLQRVEANSEETRVLVAEIGLKIDHYEQAHTQSRADLALKIEHGFERIGDDQKKLLDRLEEQSAKLNEHSKWIETAQQSITAAKTRKDARKDVVKKLVIGFLLAAVGVLGSKLAETMLVGR